MGKENENILIEGKEIGDTEENAKRKDSIISIEEAFSLAKRAEMAYKMNQIAQTKFQELIVQIAEEVLEATTIHGDENGFHNIAVYYTNQSRKDIAVQMLERGLEMYPYSVDLLADYLSYGYSCRMEEQCSKYFVRLRNMPILKMTSRGYSFAIDYLNELVKKAATEEEVQNYKIAIEQLLEEFLKRFPYSDRAYLAKANVMYNFGQFEESRQVLEEATTKLAAPQCCLRYADYLMERGDYENVVRITKRGISVSAEDQPSINVPYLFYISGLAKDALLHEKGSYDEEDVRDVYSDYRVAENMFDGKYIEYLQNLRNRVTILELKSGIPYREEK